MERSGKENAADSLIPMRKKSPSIFVQRSFLGHSRSFGDKCLTVNMNSPKERQLLAFAPGTHMRW